MLIPSARAHRLTIRLAICGDWSVGCLDDDVSAVAADVMAYLVYAAIFQPEARRSAASLACRRSAAAARWKTSNDAR